MMSDTEDPKPLRILVVDDVDLNRVLARAFLTRMGHQVEEADSGASAIGRMHEAPAIDLMLLDINMPELSGEEVCLLLRKNPQWVSLKIIAYTAHAGSLDQER
jgi:CheY-like chemotaxis protein